MKIVVTGATGYIGTRVVDICCARGHQIVAASRRQLANHAYSHLLFDLSEADTVALPIDTDAVIHLAANTQTTECISEEQEFLAAQALISASQKISAKFIFVSSQTARHDAPTIYGRTKWRIEQEALSAGGWVVRPGIVYGGEMRGLFGMLVNTVRQLPVLPTFIPAPRVQPVHVDDLAEGILRMVERADLPSGIFCLGSPVPIAFSTFLGEIAKSRLRCRRVFVPVPVMAINALAAILGEALRVRLGLERLRSLFDLPAMASSASDLKRIGLSLRSLRSGMHPSGNDRRRCLLQEGRALLAYILKQPPGSAALRRYIRATEQLRDGQALNLPKLFLFCPFFLSLLDKSAWPDEKAWMEFSWRLDAATVLTEATPCGAYRFLGLGSKYGMLNSLLLMTTAVMSEIFWRILRALFFPFARFALGRAKDTA